MLRIGWCKVDSCHTFKVTRVSIELDIALRGFSLSVAHHIKHVSCTPVTATWSKNYNCMDEITMSVCRRGTGPPRWLVGSSIFTCLSALRSGTLVVEVIVRLDVVSNMCVHWAGFFRKVVFMMYLNTRYACSHVWPSTRRTRSDFSGTSAACNQCCPIDCFCTVVKVCLIGTRFASFHLTLTLSVH